MSVEPVAARKGLEEMAALLMAAHGFAARLSAARLDIRAGAPPPDAGPRAWLARRLGSEVQASPHARRRPPPPDPLRLRRERRRRGRGALPAGGPASLRAHRAGR